MGTVIGETAEIGDDVTMYQDITLGGTSPSVNSAAQVNKKRHPTLRDRVIVGAGAQVLGAIVVGAGAKIGANAVVVSDVPAGALMVGIPAKIAAPRGGGRRRFRRLRPAQRRAARPGDARHRRADGSGIAPAGTHRRAGRRIERQGSSLRFGERRRHGTRGRQ